MDFFTKIVNRLQNVTMMKRYAFLVLLCFGCSFSPIPKNIAQTHEKSHQIKDAIEPLLQPGDLVFRLGTARIAGGLNFSRMIAGITNSDFSHAVLIYKIDNGEAIIPDISALGLQRFYLVDWLMDGNQNIVVKRLRPEYRHLIPAVLGNLEKIIETDPLYDDRLGAIEDDRFYCLEVVDYCFRQAGLILAPKIAMKNLPNFLEYAIITCIGEVFAGIDSSVPITVAGNDSIGLFSSPYLETVIDLREIDKQNN